MAIGTITRGTSSHDYTDANKRVRIRDIQLTSGANYVAGGTTINASDVGMRTAINAVWGANVATSTDGTTARTVGWKNQTDGSVKFFVYTTASAEAAGNADLSTYTVRATFVGR